MHYAQIGVCILRREDDGSVRRELLQIDNILMAGKQRLSEAVWAKLEALASSASIKLLDLTEKDIVSRVLSDFDLRNKAGGKVRFAMRSLEAEVIGKTLPQLSMERWLIADGSLLFDPILRQLSASGEIKPVIGVAKNFRKDPQFAFGKGPRVERCSIYKMLADLQAEHRTAAFSARG